MTVKSSFETACVIGLGYVGLPTAATIAARGVSVTGVDINQKVVETINSGASHILETDLDVILQGVVAIGRLVAKTKPEPADVFLITVPTPVTHDNRADLGAVHAATNSIAPALRPGSLVILESTSPIGTTEQMAAMLAKARPDLTFPQSSPNTSDVMIAYCPERILPGHTLRELVDNARTVGGLDRRSCERAVAFYKIFCKGQISQTNARTAELVKLAENAYRDVNIAFANELSMICADFTINVHDVIGSANQHPRVDILAPGPGVGGHCIPVDPWFIVEASPKRARLIRTAREVNLAKTDFVFDQIKARAERFKKPTIALLGLAYKPDVDDLRESPALTLVERCAAAKLGELLVVEPHISEAPADLAGIPKLKFCGFHDALAQADIVVPLVAHSEFRSVDRALLSEKVVVDSVGIWNK
jgi:UDP-N-acetyl-D-mannosaminuronic acid dehydrogenase